MRRWQRILLVSACAIAGFFCAWLLRDAIKTKPIVARLPNDTTLTYYASTYGTNQWRFPDPNPLKRLWSTVQNTMRLTPRVQVASPAMFDNKTAFWWFKANPSLLPSAGRASLRTSIRPTTDAPELLGSGIMMQAGPANLVGIFLKDCPTNTPTMVITLRVDRKSIFAGEKVVPVIASVTVPNPVYKR